MSFASDPAEKWGTCDNPLTILLGEHARRSALSLRKMPSTSARRFTSRLRRSLADSCSIRPSAHVECQIGQHHLLCLIEELGESRPSLARMPRQFPAPHHRHLTPCNIGASGLN